jgi:rhomboid protease GluP
MKNLMISRKPYITFLICFFILFYWSFIAFHSGQSLLKTQSCRLLLGYGAVNGQLLEQGDHWRMIVSQFTHVKFFHMLGNVIFIFLIGAYIERRFGSFVLLLVYLSGGTLGQYVSVFFNPKLVSSGASQALCALAGFLAIIFLKVWRSSKITGITVLLFVFIQCGLDWYFAGRLKEGHTFGFLVGAAMSIYFVWKAIKQGKQSGRIEEIKEDI